MFLVQNTKNKTKQNRLAIGIVILQVTYLPKITYKKHTRYYPYVVIYSLLDLILSSNILIFNIEALKNPVFEQSNDCRYV